MPASASSSARQPSGSVVWSSMWPTMTPEIGGHAEGPAPLGQDLVERAVLQEERRRIAVREFPERHPRDARQRARQPELGQHPVDAVVRLLDVLQEQDRAAQVGEVGRAAEVRHQAEVAAQQAPARFARHQGGHPVLPVHPALGSLEGRGPAEAHRRLAGPQHALELAQRIRREGAEGHRPVEGDEAGVAVDRHVERGDVAVADQRLGLALHEGVVERGQDPRGPVAAPYAPDRVHPVVGEHAVEVVGTGGVGAGQVAARDRRGGRRASP